MRLYQEGDRSAGICEVCHATVKTWMEYRDYQPTGWDVTVPDVLLAVCERCGGVVGVPHQSTPRINEYRQEKSRGLIGIEARVPRIIEDALELVTASLGGSAKLIRPAVLRYYLGLVAESPAIAEAVKTRSSSTIISGRADRRLVVKLGDPQRSAVLQAAKAAGISSQAQLLRGITILIADDCQMTHVRLHEPGAPAKDGKAARGRHQFLKQLAKTIG